MDYSLIQTLVEAAYYRFKNEYPNEEPFFKITCTRKYGRSEKRTWRNIDKSMRIFERDGSIRTHEVPLTGVKLDESVLIKNDDETKVRNEVNKWSQPRRTVPIKRTKVVDADKKTILTTKFKYDAMVDVRFDEPITVSSVRYFINTTNSLLKEVQEGYKVFLEDPTIWKSKEVLMVNVGQDVTFDDKLERAIKALKSHDEMIRSIEKKIESVEAVTQTEAFTCFDCDDVVSNLKTTFKSTLTIRDLAEKYITTQKKLNELKSLAIPIFKHYKYMKLFDMMEKEGFIRTIGFLLDFLHTLGDNQDDFDDNE